jgi:peptidoglycan/LPS O-acetylase OafA/YrhL
MTEDKLPNKNYIEQLTWLRGLAAFFVIVSHTIRVTEVKYSVEDEAGHFIIMSFFDLGRFGVVLFFALSGCTLYISNSGKVAGYKNVIIFYIKRFFRIWPAFLVSLVVYIGFSYIFVYGYGVRHGFWVEEQFYSNFSYQELTSYILLIFNITGPEGYFNNAYWSLPVEFQYYLIFPIIVTLLKYVGIVGPIILSIGLYFLPKISLIDFDDNIVFTLAFSFCGGVLVGYIYKNYYLKLNAFLGCLTLVSFIFLASAITNSYITLPDLPLISNKWNWYGGIAIVCVFISLIIKVDMHNKIEIFLKHYGTISYSTYLYHNIFIAISVLFIVNFKIYDSNLKFLITISFTLVCSYIVASMSYVYIEKPSILLGRNIIKRWFN